MDGRRHKAIRYVRLGKAEDEIVHQIAAYQDCSLAAAIRFAIRQYAAAFHGQITPEGDPNEQSRTSPYSSHHPIAGIR